MLKKFKSSRLLKWFVGAMLVVFLVISTFYLSIYLGYWGKIPDTAELSQLKQNEATEVFASEGELIGKYYIFDRQPVFYDELPQHLIDALIATEDIRFYEHSGVDSRSLFRVFFKTLLLGDRSSGGGSTISQQLAKNLFGRNDHGYFSMPVNKLRESIIARRLEDVYTKEEILGLYFNTVPFSDNTFGIESAARKFFNTTTSEINLEQAATMVGTLKASHYYNPRLFPDRSVHRRNVVLHQMEKYGYLNPEQLEKAKQQPLELKYQYFSNNAGIAPYFRSQLRKELTAILDTLKNEEGQTYNLYRDGLRIHTTLDYDMQLLAEEAMNEHMASLQQQFEKAYSRREPWKSEKLLKEALVKSEQYRSLIQAGRTEQEIMDSLYRKKDMELFDWGKKHMVQASIADSLQHYMKFLNIGMINIDPGTGAVKSWIGGINHKYFKFDHTSQSRRQIGSTFKPVVYTAALEAGMDPCMYYSPREITYEGGWTPSNSTEEEDPHIRYSMQTALSRSINTIAVKVLHDTGLPNVISQAQKMGFPPLPPYPSIALGTAEMTVKDLAGAYSGYANRGHTATPYYITRIEDKYGNKILEFAPEVSGSQAFSSTTASLMVEMMKGTVNEGTAARLRHKYKLPNDVAGKTGTTQNNKDGWFVGITPNLVSVTWVGADDHRIGFPSTSMGQGANSALPVFALLMQKMNKDSRFDRITKARFDPPSATVQRLLECEPFERDNFLERLFTGSEERKYQREEQGEEKERKGLLSRIKGLFSKKEKN